MPADAASAEARSSSRTSLSTSSIASARPVSRDGATVGCGGHAEAGWYGQPHRDQLAQVGSLSAAPLEVVSAERFERHYLASWGRVEQAVHVRLLNASSCAPRSCFSVGSVLVGVASVPGLSHRKLQFTSDTRFWTEQVCSFNFLCRTRGAIYGLRGREGEGYQEFMGAVCYQAVLTQVCVQTDLSCGLFCYILGGRRESAPRLQEHSRRLSGALDIWPRDRQRNRGFFGGMLRVCRGPARARRSYSSSFGPD